MDDTLLPFQTPFCTCVINNYNYADYVGDAVDSALHQSRPFDEIIIVDDGSNDHSLALLRERYSAIPSVNIIAKQNGGQLSAFNTGFTASRGDLVFFLDADDKYKPDYLKLALDYYAMHPACGMLFCDYSIFGAEQREVHWGRETCLLGHALIYTLAKRKWVGAPTSCLSLRRQVLEQLLPLPLENDWKICADDCLIYGASLVGARKGYLAMPLIDYRAHESNHFHAAPPDPFRAYRHKLATARLFEYFSTNHMLSTDALSKFAVCELRTHSRPSLKLCWQYFKIIQNSNICLQKKLTALIRIARHYWNGNSEVASAGFPGTADALRPNTSTAAWRRAS